MHKCGIHICLHVCVHSCASVHVCILMCLCVQSCVCIHLYRHTLDRVLLRLTRKVRSHPCCGSLLNVALLHTQKCAHIHIDNYIQPYTYNIHAHATCPNPSLSCRVLGRLYRTLLQGAHTLKNIMNKHFPGLLYLEPCRHPWDRTAGHIPSQGLPCHNSTRRVSETSEKHCWTVLT